MNRPITIIILCFLMTNLKAQQFELDTLLYNGPSKKRINCIIMGDGFLISDMAKYNNSAHNLVNSLFSHSPYKEYKNYFNVFSVFVPSNVSGAASDPSKLIDNYFGSTFNYGGIERLLVPTRADRIASVLAVTFPSYDQVIILVNSDEYGGSGGWVATASLNSLSSEIVVHELGHSFASLEDEYWNGSGHEAPNMTQQASPWLIKWINWLYDFGIDIIPYPESIVWYKPARDCEMQSLNNGFCSVCKEQFILTIHNLTNPIDQFTPITSPIDSDPVTFNLELLKPEPNTLNIKWFLDGKKIGQGVTTLNIKASDLINGTHALESLVYDSTALDRHNVMFVNSVTWSIGNSIASALSKSSANRADIITNIKGEATELTLRVFPNPIQNKLIIEYELANSSPTKLSILNAEGKKIIDILNEAQLPGKYTFEADMAGYGSGLYILDFKSGNFHKSFKLVKAD